MSQTEPATNVRLGDLAHRDRVEVIRSETRRVTGLLSELSSEELDHQAIGGWTIREVVAHLMVVAEFYLDNIERGSAGDRAISGGRPAPGTGRGSIAAEGIRERAEQVAAVLNDAAVDRLREAGLALADRLDADESILEFGCYHPGGVVPANRFNVLFLKELGLHEWDMFEALRAPWPMSRWGVDAAIQAMEEELASGSLRWVTDPSASPDAISFRVITSGHVTVERDLVVEPGQTRLVAVDDQRESHSLLRVDGADFVLGLSGRHDLATVVEQGRGEGDIDALKKLGRRLTGM
ncbi:MAG: maleylpyruvate isomerase N-terminal domain-containing protein [Acidimicrobiales bacterium]